MKSTSSARQISAIFFAMRHTNFSDSITHGPRMNAGRFPAIVTLPTRNGFVFTMKDGNGGLWLSHYFCDNAFLLTRSTIADGAYNARNKMNATPGISRMERERESE